MTANDTTRSREKECTDSSDNRVRRRRILGCLGSVGIIALAGCAEQQEGEVNGDGGGDGDDTVVVHEHTLGQDSIGDAVIEGEATNQLGEEETIYLEATFYDGGGTIIDDGLSDRNEDIPDGQRFQFEIISTVGYNEVDDYDLEWSTGF